MVREILTDLGDLTVGRGSGGGTGLFVRADLRGGGKLDCGVGAVGAGTGDDSLRLFGVGAAMADDVVVEPAAGEAGTSALGVVPPFVDRR